MVRPDCDLVTSSSLPSARLDFAVLLGTALSGLNWILPCGCEYVPATATPVEVTRRLLRYFEADKGEATGALFLEMSWADVDASGDFFRPC